MTHSGGLPGFLSLLTLFPHDGLGVISFIAHEATTLNTEITNRIAIDVLNLDSSFQLQSGPQDPLMAPAPPSTFHDTPAPYPFEDVPLLPDSMSLEDCTVAPEDYAGTYHHPGYGTFTLCHRSSKEPTCRELLSNYTKVFPTEDLPTLHATWDRIWFSHIRITILPINLALLHTMTLFPEGYAQDKTPFAHFFPTIGGNPLPYKVFLVRLLGGNITGLIWHMDAALDSTPDSRVLFLKQ